MDLKGLRGYFLLTLIIASFLLAVQILMPFLAPLALAAAFAVVLQPLYVTLRRDYKGRDGLAALSTLVIVGVCVIIPLTTVGILIGHEATKLYTSLSDGSFGITASTVFRQTHDLLASHIPVIGGFSDSLATNLNTYASDTLAWLSGHVGVAFSSIASILLNLFVFLVALFFFLRDGDAWKRTIIELSPLDDADDEKIFDRLELAVNSVIRGNLLIALIRGLVASIGFFFFGVPNPALWGTVTGLAGLVPGIGIAIVFAPAVLYEYFSSGSIPAIGLAAWGILVVGLIDNILGPKLVGKGMEQPPLFVLLSILGGISYFGPVGIFLGPLSLSLLFALVSIYARPNLTRKT